MFTYSIQSVGLCVYTRIYIFVYFHASQRSMYGVKSQLDGPFNWIILCMMLRKSGESWRCMTWHDLGRGRIPLLLLYPPILYLLERVVKNLLFSMGKNILEYNYSHNFPWLDEWNHRRGSTKRPPMATFCRTFHHDGKFSPAWWGCACMTSPFHSIYVPSWANKTYTVSAVQRLAFVLRWKLYVRNTGKKCSKSFKMKAVCNSQRWTSSHMMNKVLIEWMYNCMCDYVLACEDLRKRKGKEWHSKKVIKFVLNWTCMSM